MADRGAPGRMLVYRAATATHKELLVADSPAQMPPSSSAPPGAESWRAGRAGSWPASARWTGPLRPPGRRCAPLSGCAGPHCLSGWSPGPPPSGAATGRRPPSLQPASASWHDSPVRQPADGAWCCPNGPRQGWLSTVTGAQLTPSAGVAQDEDEQKPLSFITQSSKTGEHGSRAVRKGQHLPACCGAQRSMHSSDLADLVGQGIRWYRAYLCIAGIGSLSTCQRQGLTAWDGHPPKFPCSAMHTAAGTAEQTGNFASDMQSMAGRMQSRTAFSAMCAASQGGYTRAGKDSSSRSGRFLHARCRR